MADTPRSLWNLYTLVVDAWTNDVRGVNWGYGGMPDLVMRKSLL